MKELVEVLLVETRLVAVALTAVVFVIVALVPIRSVITPLILFKLVEKILEEVAFVTREEDAKIFSANKLKNLLREVPIL
jgi:hypothetical protein